MTIDSINPFNGEVLKFYKVYTTEEVTRKIELTHAAGYLWKPLSFGEKGEYLKKAAFPFDPFRHSFTCLCIILKRPN